MKKKKKIEGYLVKDDRKEAFREFYYYFWKLSKNYKKSKIHTFNFREARTSKYL